MEKVMHETMQRLFDAAKKVQPSIQTLADLARALNQSEQVINNWAYRGKNGVSKQGRLLAQKQLGISAIWIEDGQGPMLMGHPGPIEWITRSVDSIPSPMRLRIALVDKHVTPEALARFARVSTEVAAQWLDGKGPEINLAQATAVQNAYGINAVWLMSGKGESGVAIPYADEWRPIPISEMYGVPVRGMAQLGDNGYWADIDYPDGVGEGYVDIPKKNRDTYALKCVGDSMKPRIKNGEYVVIEPSVPYAPGDEVLVKSTDGRVMIKIFLYERSGRVHLISVNENHPPMSIESDKIEKIHYVASINKPTQWRPD